MKLTARINGKPVEIEIDLPSPRLALTRTEAAKALGVCERTVWRLASTGEIARTSYGTYPVASLQAHLEAETKKSNR